MYKVEKEVYRKLRINFPDLTLVQVIHVVDELSVKEVKDLQDEVDTILLDSGNPNKAIKELGGTGKTHDWKISSNIVSASKIPVFLPGGLDFLNVESAIKEVSPLGVAICSVVRSEGKLDELKLNSFIRKVREHEEN